MSVLSSVPDLPVLGAFTLAALVLIATPGPDMALFLSKAIAQGRAAGAAALLGALTGVLIHTLLAALGLSALLAASATAFDFVKIAGALYLLWLAWEALRHGSALRLAPEAERAGAQLGKAWAAGLGVNLLNPKIVLFFVTFLPQFVDPADPHARGKLFFLGLYFIALALPCCLAMVFAAERLAGLVRRSPRVTRAIDYGTAGLFGAFAVKMLTARTG